MSNVEALRTPRVSKDPCMARSLLLFFRSPFTVSVEMLEDILVPADKHPSVAAILEMPFVTDSLRDR